MNEVQGVDWVTAETPPQIPHGSVVITPSQMYELMQATDKKVDHLTSIIDPSLNEIRGDVADNARRIADVETKSKDRDEKLDERLREQETRHVVTPRAMWTGIGTIAAVVAVIASTAIAILR